jgi:hypothetical protein
MLLSPWSLCTKTVNFLLVKIREICYYLFKFKTVFVENYWQKWLL